MRIRITEYLKCVKGMIIKNDYKMNKILNKTNRSLLSTLIVDTEINITGCSTIPANRLIELAAEINQMFPNEKYNIYYVGYNKILKQMPRGRLYDSLNSLKRKMKKGIAPKPVKIVPQITTDLASKLNYLKSYDQEFKVSAIYWKDTHELRFHSPDVTIYEYMDAYMSLKGPNGYILLEIDFNLMYPSKENCFFMKWAEIYIKILNIIKSSVRESKKGEQKFLKDQLNKYNGDNQIDTLYYYFIFLIV